MKFNIAIVEDSQGNIEVLLYMLEKSPYEIEIKGIAKTIGEAKLLLTRPDIDLAFLDIQLKEGTIFEVLDSLDRQKDLNFDMVFVTAHGSYENALRGIQFACLDFINKPIDQEELNVSLSKLSEKHPSKPGNQQINFLLDWIQNETAHPKTLGIVLPKGIIEFVPLDEILLFTADQSICRISMEAGKQYVSSKHLGYYIELLNQHHDFIQSSKSHLVNLNQVKQYDHRERTIRFKNGEHTIASHRFSKDVRKQILGRQGKAGFFKGGLGNLYDRFR